jgi:hypothetical protein
VSEWSYREAAGGIPESAREPSPVYPAGSVGTPADPNTDTPSGGGGGEFGKVGGVGAGCKAVTRASHTHAVRGIRGSR